MNINTEELNNATKVAQQFTFQVIRIATNNFSTVLGEGGFGPVYKGNLPNGLEVAVKILSSTSTQGPQQFLNEVFVPGMETLENDACTFIQALVRNVI